MVFIGSFFAFDWLFAGAEVMLVMVLVLCWLLCKGFLICVGLGFIVLLDLLWG